MPESSNPWLPPHLRKPYSSSTVDGKYLFKSHPPPPLPNAYDLNFPPLALGRPAAVHVPWADLPPDIIRAIAQRLTVPEYLCTLLACTRWASALRQQPLLPSAPHFPFLALVPHDDPNTLRLMSLPEHRSYQPPLPWISGTAKCVGCRGGWLVFVHDAPIVDAHIVNPITRDLICLPSLRVLHKGEHVYLCFEHVVKIALSDDKSCAMLVYRHRYLAFARSGDDVWTKLYLPRNNYNKIADVAYHGGKFFVMLEGGIFRYFDLTGPTPKAKLFERSALSDENDEDDNKEYKYELRHGRRWLVSTPSGDLLQVRAAERGWSETRAFVIKRFDPEVHSCWHDATDLMSGCTLFLDHVQATALSAEEVPGLKGNRVYFLDQSRGGEFYDRKSVRMLDIGEGIFRLGFPPDYILKVHISNMFWFMPSLI